MPRSVPRYLLKAMFAWAITGFRPWSRNSFWQNARAKKPRSSSRGSRSRMNAPVSFVSVKIMFSSALQDCLSVPAQRTAQAASLDAGREVVDAPEARPLELLQGQTVPAIVVRHLLGAETCIPRGLELGQEPADLAEIDAVAPLVRSCVGGVVDPAAGHDLFDDLGQLPDAAVVVVDAHIEGLVVHDVSRRVERRDEGPRDVFDVDNGAPRRAVAHEKDDPGGHPERHQVVHHQVEAHAWGGPVGGRVAQE